MIRVYDLRVGMKIGGRTVEHISTRTAFGFVEVDWGFDHADSSDTIWIDDDAQDDECVHVGSSRVVPGPLAGAVFDQIDAQWDAFYQASRRLEFDANHSQRRARGLHKRMQRKHWYHLVTRPHHEQRRQERSKKRGRHLPQRTT